MPGARYTYSLVLDNWRKNYRHHGGLAAVIRCSLGMWRLMRRAPLPEQAEPGGIDCVTFSVVPNLTALWARLMRAAIPDGRARVWIGDCSGGFGPSHHFTSGVHAVPMINYLHGLKLDLFLEKFIRSEFFVVSDDDVFWLDETPWRWAMQAFARDPKLAVVSLVPRERFTWELNGQQYQPMGSYCLVVRRAIWLREKLSFQAVPKPSPSQSSYAGHYDTCDLANVELIQRGYHIAIAPPEIRNHLAVFKGISNAILRVQKAPEQGYAQAFGDGPAPMVQACMVADQLADIIRTVAPQHRPATLADPELLARAEAELTPLLNAAEVARLRDRVEELCARVRTAALAGANAPTTVTA